MVGLTDWLVGLTDWLVGLTDCWVVSLGLWESFDFLDLFFWVVGLFLVVPPSPRPWRPQALQTLKLGGFFNKKH